MPEQHALAAQPRGLAPELATRLRPFKELPRLPTLQPRRLP